MERKGPRPLAFAGWRRFGSAGEWRRVCGAKTVATCYQVLRQMSGEAFPVANLAVRPHGKHPSGPLVEVRSDD
jgi:hypothetical protein